MTKTPTHLIVFVNTSSPTPYLRVLLSYMYVFSSPEHKVLKVSFCDGYLLWVGACVCPPTVSLNNFSETTHWILTKLHRNDPWVVLYQSCSNRSFFSWTANGTWVVPVQNCSSGYDWLLERMFKLCPSIKWGPAWGHIWARGFGSVVKHSTADPGIASSIPSHSN